MLEHVAILYHPRRKQAVEEAEWLAQELQARGVSTTVRDAWGQEVSPRLAEASNLVAVLGGDGTIIRAARSLTPCGTPILGVNLGRVGFLAELTPQALHEQVDAVVAESFWIEHRSMLEVRLGNGASEERFLCLNEVSVARGPSPRAVHVHTRIDGDAFVDYVADGVLVVTATGSTAYSLAAGGPILYPESTDFMLTPVAPHLHIGRSILVPGDTVAELSLTGDRPGILSVDGAEERELLPHTSVQVRRSEHRAPFARLGQQSYFYAAIAARLT